MKCSDEIHGLYVSYNEDKNGCFEEAVQISNNFDHVTWLSQARRDLKKLRCATKIFIRLTGRDEKYYSGSLLSVLSANELGPEFFVQEERHRPLAWKKKDGNTYPRPNIHFKTVLLIGSLKRCDKRPSELGDLPAPQGPLYVRR